MPANCLAKEERVRRNVHPVRLHLCKKVVCDFLRSGFKEPQTLCGGTNQRPYNNKSDTVFTSHSAVLLTRITSYLVRVRKRKFQELNTFSRTITIISKK